MADYETGEKERKKPESEAEKRLKEIREMEERDFRNLRNKLNRGRSLTASEAKKLEDYRKKFEMMSRDGLPDHVVTSKEAVARHFGKTKRTIINWGHRGMPQLPNGYDLPAVEACAVEEGLIGDKLKGSNNGGKSSESGNSG
jgi:hypothetical protein